MLNFGSIFFVNNKEYVLLLSDGEIIYSAIILGAEETKDVKRNETIANRKGTSHENILYCYVELCTENYGGCSANMITATECTNINFEIIRDGNKKLNNEDLKNIKDEILEYKDLFKPVLGKYMESISF